LLYDRAVENVILTAVVLAALGWGVLAYNLLVRDKHRVAQAWSDVEVQLKRRHDLVPKLVEVVKRHAGFEQSVLEQVTRLRALGEAGESPARLGTIETQLSAGVHRLVALAESYPELKASDSFLNLQHNLTEVENQIQYARRYYNGAVNGLNTRIETFPDLLVARLLRFTPAEYFDFEPARGGPG
jgi:LemA protein